jgi:hypothetical protein
MNQNDRKEIADQKELEDKCMEEMKSFIRKRILDTTAEGGK